MIKDYVTLDYQSQQPLYLQIRDGLRESIRLQLCKPGESLPTERVMAKELGVSVGIVRQALSILVDEGLIHRRRQRGTFVSDIDPESLQKTDTKTIGVVFCNLAGSFMADILKGVGHELLRHNYHMITCDSSNSADRERQSVDSLMERNVDGFIIFPVLQESAAPVVPAHYRRMLQANIPFVFIDCYIPKVDSNYVVFDNYGGAYAAVKYLVDQGHKRIAHISSIQAATSVCDRLAGYTDALISSGIPFDPDLVGMYDHQEDNLEGLVDWLVQKQVTSIFCLSDVITYRVYNALRCRDTRVPDDIELVGFGTTDGIELIYPKLSTVSVPSAEMGRRAAETLLEIIAEGPGSQPRKIVLDTELLLREDMNESSSCRNGLVYA